MLLGQKVRNTQIDVYLEQRPLLMHRPLWFTLKKKRVAYHCVVSLCYSFRSENVTFSFNQVFKENKSGIVYEVQIYWNKLVQFSKIIDIGDTPPPPLQWLPHQFGHLTIFVQLTFFLCYCPSISSVSTSTSFLSLFTYLSVPTLICFHKTSIVF